MREVKLFETKYLEPAIEFMSGLDLAARKKIQYNIGLAEYKNDPRLFKKLSDDIWEFRTRFWTQQIRLLAFWDKTDRGNTLVVVTHGFIKKVDKVRGNEINRAKNIREKYFETKKP